MILRKISLTGFVIFCGLAASAQDQVNVPYQNLLNVNPSFAGSNGFIRNQSTIDLPSTNGMSNYFGFQNNFDAYFSSVKSGVALSNAFVSDNNIYKSSSISLAYSKYFEAGENLKIIPSLQAGYTVDQLNLGYYTTSMFQTPGSTSSWIRTEYFTLNSGLLVNYKNFYAGVSVFNLNRPDVGFFAPYRTPSRVNVHASYNMHVSENLLLNFYGQSSWQSNYNSALLSVNALCFKHLVYGIGYQTNASLSMNAGFRSDYFTVQAAYSRTFNALVPENYEGSWRLLLSFNLRKKELQKAIVNFEAW